MDFNSKKPIYLQIADYFLENVIIGKMSKGNRILSVRDLAVELGVNPNTVMRAYTYLQEEKIIFNKRGIGYFIDKDAVKNAKSIKMDEFIKDELPNVFKTMSVLDLDIKDLGDLYKSYLKTNKNDKYENK